MGTLESGGGDAKQYGVREGELSDAKRTKGRCQLEQERRGSPTECGEKLLLYSVSWFCYDLVWGHMFLFQGISNNFWN